MPSPIVSIIIRTKNEERWIGRCLRMVFKQDFRRSEVLVVDNGSTDRTLAIARKFPVRVLSIGSYRPGKALNAGIRASSSQFIACLSAHCIPSDARWLGRLVAGMRSARVAGVYGRQLPMAYTSDVDKRDLLLTFGLDRRVQVRDGFFHNANSLIRRSVWEKTPFDEKTPNIEDRIWGETVVKRGLRLVYEPSAAVYHYHGIHQNLDRERASSVVRILEDIAVGQDHPRLPHGFDHESMRVLAIVPVLGRPMTIAGHDLLDRTLTALRAARHLSRVVVIAEHPAALAAARAAGATALPRPKSLSAPRVGTEQVLRHALEHCETGREFYDSVLYASILYPFRPRGFFDDLIAEFARTGVDTIVPSLSDFQACWREEEGKLIRCDAGLMPRRFKKPLHRGLIGLGTLTSSEFIRQGTLLGGEIGLAPVSDALYSIRVTDHLTRSIAAMALEKGEATLAAGPHGRRSRQPTLAR
ncbi:MAG: glycosyltransferase family 2 protein [Elusimicrobiota bacterium]|jgi:hypothetical protein